VSLSCFHLSTRFVRIDRITRVNSFVFIPFEPLPYDRPHRCDSVVRCTPLVAWSDGNGFPDPSADPNEPGHSSILPPGSQVDPKMSLRIEPLPLLFRHIVPLGRTLPSQVNRINFESYRFSGEDRANKDSSLWRNEYRTIHARPGIRPVDSSPHINYENILVIYSVPDTKFCVFRGEIGRFTRIRSARDLSSAGLVRTLR